ncbi:hypothetical protein ACT3SP_04615 [Brachybacterium sp. AOP43-C2-M15]|uniref:hypothetical protein n=1 Tax=Brachybacterium sp. AOP43-C2-M15 TaxID=3457661 RepID=UPI004034EAC1
MRATPAHRGGLLLTLLVGLLVLVLASAPAAHACSCGETDFEEAAESADLIADLRIEHAISEEAGDVTYRAVVDTVWKGEESRTLRFTTSEEVTACGLGRIPDGTELLVWAFGGDGSYSTTWCALPVDGGPDDRERLTELLGEPADLTDQPVPLEPESLQRPWSGVAVAVGAGAVALAIAVRATALAAVLALHGRRRD